MAKVLRQDSRFTAMWDRLVCASLDKGRQMDVLRIVPAESEDSAFYRTINFVCHLFCMCAQYIGSKFAKSIVIVTMLVFRC